MKEYSYSDIMVVEDSLQEAQVFLNAIRGTPCHSDSYMTVVDFVALGKWIKSQVFDRDHLQSCIDYWTTNLNMQPPLRLVGFTLNLHLHKEN
jgi:hypothetical protein